MPLLEFDARLRYASGFRVEVRFTTDAPVTGLFGPSGSGKTSVLSMLAGLRKPDAGRIQVGGRVLFDSQAGVNLRPEARRIGYVFQDHLLFPHLSVCRNLLYGWRRQPSGGRRPTVHPVGRPDARPASNHPLSLDRVVQVLELGDLLQRFPHTLSGGQRQRVALGRALLANPDLLLLDEPLASVDEELAEKVLDFIEQALNEWPIPTLYVTHNAAELKRLATHIVRLQGGRLVGAGTPGELLRTPGETNRRTATEHTNHG